MIFLSQIVSFCLYNYGYVLNLMYLIHVLMSFTLKIVMKNHVFKQPFNLTTETGCQTYNNLAAILDAILSK